MNVLKGPLYRILYWFWLKVRHTCFFSVSTWDGVEKSGRVDSNVDSPTDVGLCAGDVQGCQMHGLLFRFKQEEIIYCLISYFMP